jgi:hypothetical protein
MVGTPLYDQAGLLNQGLPILAGDGLHAGNGGVRDRELNPTVPIYTRTGRQRHEMIVPLRISRRGEGDGSQRSGTCCIGGVGVLEDLDVSAQLYAHGIVVRRAGPNDNCCRTHCGGDAVFVGKLI